MHTAKSHIKIVPAATTQNVVAARAFDSGFLKRYARRCSYATATYANGQTRSVTRTITFDAPPVVTFTSPNDFQTFGAINPTSPRDLTGNVERPVTLTGTVSKPFAQITRVMINQQSATLTATAGSNGATTTFTFPNFFLREGTNLVTATATDAGGQVGTASLTLYVDQTAPILTLEAPVNTGLAGLAMPFGKSNNTPSAVVPQALTSNARIDVRGIVNDAVEGGLKVPYPTVTVNNVTTGLTTPGKVSDRYFIVEDVPLDVGQNELTVTATDWVGNARSQKLTVSRVNVGSNRITLAGGNRQRGALNTELAKPLIVTAIDRAGLPLANIALTFEVLRGTGSINPATTSSTTTTTGTGSNTVTTTIPNALTGALQPKTKPNGVNPARRLLIATDANGRAAVWFTLGKQSGEAGNMVQVSGSDANSSNANLASPASDAISESVVFTATGDRGVPAKILAEGGGAQYAEAGGQPLDALTAVTYDGEVNPVPGAVIAYVIEQDGGVDLDDGAKFTTSSASNALAISANRKVLISTADNNGRSAARPTMGVATGTVRISTYAMPANTAVTTALVEGLASGTALTTTPGLVGLATFQIAVLPQSDGPTQFTGKILDHTGKPLQGVRVTISRTPLSVTTDVTGNFSFLQDVPQGKLDLFVDGRAVTGTTPLPGGQTTPTQYPSLHFEVLAIRGQKNILPHPIYLPPILMSQAKIVGGNEDVSLTIPGRDGFEMIVKANSVTFPDGTRIGPLVVSPVADDRLPMSPPGGGSSFMPGAAATIQPSGTRFDPPIEVRLPNTSGYAPGERVVIYHWDHDIGQYVAMGQATVTDDGAQLITDPGSGITKAGWHGPPTPPPPPPNCARDGDVPSVSAVSATVLVPRPSEIRRFAVVPFRVDATTQGCQTLTYEWKFTDSETLKGQVVYKGLYLPGAGAATVTAECSKTLCGRKQTATASDTVTFTVLGGKKYDDLKKRISECTGVVCLPALLDEANRRVDDLEKKLAKAECASDAQCVAETTEDLKRARGDQSFAKGAVEVTKFTKDAREFAAALNALTEFPWLSDAIREFKAGVWTRLAQLEANGSLPPAVLKYLALSAAVGDILVPSTLLEGLIVADAIRGLAAYGRIYGTAALDAKVAEIPLTAAGRINIELFSASQVFQDLLAAAAYSDRAALLSAQLAARNQMAAELSSGVATRGNVAVAKGEISGYGNVDLRAFSQKEMEAYEGWVKSAAEGTEILPWQTVGGLPRNQDTEYKILDYLAHQIRADAKGEVWIYTERFPCVSCQNAAIEFERLFPNVDVKLFSGTDGYYVFQNGVAVFKPLPALK